MTMPLDPYAPPTTPAAAAVVLPRAASVSDYAEERRSLLLVVVLTVVTLGVYPAIWLWRRQPFLDRLDSGQRLGAGAPVALIAMNIACFGLMFAELPEAAYRFINLGLAGATLALQFKVMAMLRSDFLRTGRLLEVKGVWVFFFGTIYLQQVINRAAETPAHIVRAKKRKKKKARAAEAEAEAEATADAHADTDASG